MNGHLDQTDFLEILYLDETDERRARHLGTCTDCHDRFSALRAEMASDRDSVRSRVDAKPDQFWNDQRDEIVARAVASGRSRFGFLRMRFALTIAMVVLLVTIGLVMIRTSNLDQTAPSPTDTASTAVVSPGLFEEEELRELDPWETDELEPFHQIVEWEEWLDDDEFVAAVAPEEES